MAEEITMEELAKLTAARIRGKDEFEHELVEILMRSDAYKEYAEKEQEIKFKKSLLDRFDDAGYDLDMESLSLWGTCDEHLRSLIRSIGMDDTGNGAERALTSVCERHQDWLRFQ